MEKHLRSDEILKCNSAVSSGFVQVGCALGNESCDKSVLVYFRSKPMFFST